MWFSSIVLGTATCHVVTLLHLLLVLDPTHLSGLVVHFQCSNQLSKALYVFRCILVLVVKHLLCIRVCWCLLFQYQCSNLLSKAFNEFEGVCCSTCNVVTYYQKNFTSLDVCWGISFHYQCSNLFKCILRGWMYVGRMVSQPMF